MSGKLKSSIIQDFENSFIQNCLILWGEAFAFVKANKTVTIDLEEENISALFFDYIDTSEHAIALNINIADEHRLYYNLILSGKKSAKSASRIDFRLTTNCIEQLKRIEFFIEAKNLIENDCFKVGRKTKLSSSYLIKRYIETGIDNFTNGKYPRNGCIVGYVIEGKTDSIVMKINLNLEQQDRSTEKLFRSELQIPNLSHCFCSVHNSYQLKHYLLEF